MRDEDELLRTPQDAKRKCTDVVVPCFASEFFSKMIFLCKTLLSLKSDKADVEKAEGMEATAAAKKVLLVAVRMIMSTHNIELKRCVLETDVLETEYFISNWWQHGEGTIFSKHGTGLSSSLHLSADVSVGFSCYLDVFGDLQVQTVHEVHVGNCAVAEACGEVSESYISHPPTHTHTHFVRYMTAALRRQASQWHHRVVVRIIQS